MNDPMVIYKTLDINQDGHISADEFGRSTTYLKQFANYESSNEASSGMNNIFKTLDLNNNGKIEPNEIDNSLEGLMDDSLRTGSNYKPGNIHLPTSKQSTGDISWNPYTKYGLNLCFDVVTITKSWAHEIQWNIKGASTNVTCRNKEEFENNQVKTIMCCLPTLENEFKITCKDTYGDGWHLGHLEIMGKRYCENFTHGHEFSAVMSNPAKQSCENAEDAKLKANVESVFEFDSKDLTDDSKVETPFSNPNLNSGIKLKAQVRVQSFTDHTLRAQMNRIRFYSSAGPISLMAAHEILGAGEVAFSARGHGITEFKRFLEEPMMFSEKRGMLKNLVVSKYEPDCVTKIKKSLMAELQKSSASQDLKLLKKQAILKPLQIPSQPKKADM